MVHTTNTSSSEVPLHSSLRSPDDTLNLSSTVSRDSNGNGNGNSNNTTVAVMGPEVESDSEPEPVSPAERTFSIVPLTGSELNGTSGNLLKSRGDHGGSGGDDNIFEILPKVSINAGVKKGNWELQSRRGSEEVSLINYLVNFQALMF